MNRKKYLLCISAILLVASLTGVLTAFKFLPDEVKSKVPQISYEHSGSFDYQVYLKPSYLFGPEPFPTPVPIPVKTVTPTPSPKPPDLSNLKYPAYITDRFSFTFEYKFLSEEPVEEVTQEIEATARYSNMPVNDSATSLYAPFSTSVDTPKIVLLPKTAVAGDTSKTNFDLVLPEGVTYGDITVDVHVSTIIQSDTSPIFESFKQSVVIKLNNDFYEVNRNSLNYAESSYLGSLSYRQLGKIEYTVLTRNYSPIGAVTVEVPSTTPPDPLPDPPEPLPPPATPAQPLRIIGPDQPIFVKLVDRINASFAYRFNADKPVNDLSEEVSIVAVIDADKAWSKTLIIMEPSKIQGSFAMDFPIDISRFLQVIENIRNETGVSADSYKLTLQVDMRISGITEYGIIDEVFSPTLSTNLGNGIIDWTEELKQSKTGMIETTRIISNPDKYLGLSLTGIRTLSVILVSVLFLLFIFSVVVYFRTKPKHVSEIEKEIVQIKKKYGERMMEVTGQIPLNGDKVIPLDSMDDLIKVADELSRPIAHYTPYDSYDSHTYYVLDGTLHYCYTPSNVSKKTEFNPSSAV